MTHAKMGGWLSFLALASSVCLLAGGTAGSAQTGDADQLPPPRDALGTMRKVNAWQLAHPVMPPGDRNWERGTWYTGVMAAGKATGDRGFLDQAVAWGRENQWQVGTEQDGANRLFCVETWLELYFLSKDQSRIEPAIRWLRTPEPNSPAGAKRWYLEDGRMYVDSLYGAVALAMLSKATQDPKYLDIMRAFFDDVEGELLDKQVGLFYRDSRFIGQKTKNGKKIFWSRGNGWAFAGIARILEYLPKDDPEWPRYLGLFRRMAGELVKRQGSDGLWRPNLDDPEDMPVPETSGTGFFCYGLAWGINHRFLQAPADLAAVRKAWAGLCRNVSAEGKVLWGQQVADGPEPVKREDTHEYVTGTFLLAGSEVYKLAEARVERHLLGE